MTTQAEIDLLRALFRFDFIGFAQHSADLDPAGPDYGRTIDAAFRLAVRRQFPARPADGEITEFVHYALGKLGDGGQDLDSAAAVRLVAAALDDGPAEGAREEPQTEEAAQIKVLLTYRIVADSGLTEADQGALLTGAQDLAA